MKKLLIAGLILLCASCTGKKSDTEIITDFYKAVLGETEMTDALLEASLSKEVLEGLWEADFDNSYSWWDFRTAFQDGPSEESALESIDPLGDGWYRVSYSDMGHTGITDVKVADGKICDYRPFRVPYETAKGYFVRNDVEIGSIPAKILSQEELLSFFGQATVMGPGGMPTEIDFEKSFVIPVVFPETDQELSIIVEGIFHTAPEQLTLMVDGLGGEEHPSFTTVPCELLIIDGFYRDYEIIRK